MSVKEIADRYIGRDGGPPKRNLDRKKQGVPEDLKRFSSRASDMMAVAIFIGTQHPGTMSGGVYAGNALSAFARLVSMSEEDLLRVIRGRPR